MSKEHYDEDVHEYQFDEEDEDDRDHKHPLFVIGKTRRRNKTPEYKKRED